MSGEVPTGDDAARGSAPGVERSVAPSAGEQAPDVSADDAEDRALLAAHVAGDGAAFGRLVTRHQDRLWAVALRTCDDREQAADALQDALLSACRAAGGYRGQARVTTWLHRIVVNACLDALRRQRARPTVPLPEDHRAFAGDRDEMAERDTALVVEQALAQLPTEQRLAILLVDVQGFGIRDAARVLGVAEGTVKSRCSRGRARLAITLGHLRNRPDARTVPPAVAQQRADARPEPSAPTWHGAHDDDQTGATT